MDYINISEPLFQQPDSLFVTFSAWISMLADSLPNLVYAVLESWITQKYHVRFGGGLLEKC